ncbi:OmcA/MtrC family decaheme c-type cytochrome [Shewanella glacialipiscicola]|uniref:OmcA/MtrC family decaheme c-type cytochrome n=1 Tax=Shewanella glacialipiscicola TaxID=614069 RepID=UPI0021D9CA58|nr:OmcA/MtrC family decaheme c-type cytochrome [Shewanella glacialipiscicola]MCU7994625.1 OmcA/MtrC family decaheme c-type cytochrome [Shewanella glacialipiscicola]MCU8026096.1 OmcA/MtrC family decaheme c-type cytochrome [Shewanella glacialipiscicola]
MMNTHKTKIALLLAASAVTMALTGCGGSDGNSGEPGEPGGEPAGAIKTLNFTFEKAIITDGLPHVDFRVTNEDDMPVVGLQYFKFYAEQLVPQGATGAGNASQWQYLVDETCDLTPKVNKCAGTLVDNKNGSYSYSFSTNLKSSTRATYNSDLAQRVVLNNYIRGTTPAPLPDGTTLPVFTGIFDYVADTGAEATYSRKIVTTASCNTCHEDVINAKHYTSDVNFCASCHTEGKVKPGNEFNVLVHAKHKDLKLGSLDSCQSCHTASDAAPDWDNWSRIPTAATCGSCHSNIDFAAGKGHSQQLDNSNCIACHNSNWTAELHTGKTADKKAVIAQLGMSAALAAQADDTAILTVSILDKDGNAIDAATVQDKIKRLETATNVGPNFPIMGYNPSPGSGKAKIAKDLVKDGALQAGVTIVDGKLVFTTPALPFGAGDTDTAFTFIGLEMCNTGTTLTACTTDSATTSMKAELAFGTKSGKAPSMRHVNSVEFGTCQGCHGDTFEIHKGHHSGFVMTEQVSHAKDANGKAIVGVDGCVACHTPDGTYASGANKGALEMKLHVVHGKQGVIKECTQCHNDFNLDAFKVKGALATSAGKYTTPITATCTSCHTPESIGHGLENMGAIVNGDYVQANQAAQSETCFYCHKPTPTDHTQVKM